jgi:predicted dehydrogenase
VIQIAFLGCDSSHTEAFAERINNPTGPFYGTARVASIWGEDHSQAQRKAAALGIPRICQTVEDALNNIDLAMVIGRFGDSHFEPARLALERRLPTFVDKPFTLNVADASELIRLAQTTGGRICSSSPLRFAKELRRVQQQAQTIQTISVASPANCIDLGDDRRFDSAFFYGIHAVEMLLEILGPDVKRCKVTAGKTAIHALMEFAGISASIHFIKDVEEFYELSLYTTTGRQHLTIDLDGSYYSHLLAFILERFYPGLEAIPQESSLQAISLLEQVERAVGESKVSGVSA